MAGPDQGTPGSTDEGPAVDALAAFRTAVANGDLRQAGALAATLSTDELRDALRDLSPDTTAALFQELGDEQLAALVDGLDPEDAADVLARLSGAEAADVLEELAPDDAADVVGALEAMDPDTAESILVEMEAAEAEDVRALLAYPPETAGGRMTPEFFAVTPQVTVEEAVQALRALLSDGEFRSYVYVTDQLDRLVGVLPLYRLVLARADAQVGELMLGDPVRVRTLDDQEEVARIFREKRFLAVPVVDEADRLVGVVTADDIADVLEAEATEDVQRLAGSQPLDRPYLRTGPVALARKRVVWLLLLFIGAAYTSTVLQFFEDDLQATVALAFFIPLLIGTGGNVGSQTVMTVIRALAVGDVTVRDLGRVWAKEAAVGLLLGAVMGAVTLGRALVLGVGPDVGVAVAAAAAAIVVWAATVAAILPLLLHRLKIDPAVVSAPLITTLVDGTGLFLYLGIARALLGA
ncbi:MAG: magnesium transporter [Chloroflexota bacterium]